MKTLLIIVAILVIVEYISIIATYIIEKINKENKWTIQEGFFLKGHMITSGMNVIYCGNKIECYKYYIRHLGGLLK